MLAIGASIISNSSFYILLYIPTYGQKTLGLPGYHAVSRRFVGGIVLADDAGVRPLVGQVAAADHGGHGLAVRPDVMAGLFPDGVVAHALGVRLRLARGCNFSKAGYSGVLPSLLGEQFPVATRAIGVSLSFSRR